MHMAAPVSVAVVGVAVELPGASDMDALWNILKNGLNTVSEIPAERFDVSTYSNGPLNPGRAMTTRFGNFCQDLDAFDHAFFHISPREARSMDPQQRLLLRGAYNALENAGYVPYASPTFNPKTFASYIGVAANDYVLNLRNNIDVYYSTGTLHAFLSGKISYAFGFGGPSMSIDTACSASFVAIHQACRALSNGDCNAAIAGGVNAITSPDMYLGLARGHFLSDTGQCRPWDASADGYCRSEGCGLFVLKRLEDALAENDRILGVIRSVEANHSSDSRSITHPCVPSQVALFEKLIASAAVPAGDIDVIECHGTGTQAGDPTELEAVRNVFAATRSADNPLHITSIKANIGHVETASGAASLAKVILMMRKKTIPAHPSFKRLNPKIPDLASDNIHIDTSSIPWPTPPRGKRLALINNFGASGSNVAVILEEHIDPPRKEDRIHAGLVLGISCRSVSAVEQRRKDYIAQLEQSIDDVFLQDFAYSATARRQPHKYRLSVSGLTTDELLTAFRTAEIVQSSPATNVIYVFSGQGSHYAGMGAELYRSIPLVARSVDTCDQKLVRMGFASIRDMFCGSPGADTRRTTAPDYFEATQSALFVLEYSLATLWSSWGLNPCAVLGHSFGEYAALACAGVLSLEDGLKLVATRARLMTEHCSLGQTTMAVVRASADHIQPLMVAYPDLAISCYNSAAHCTIGGKIEQLEAFETLCRGQGIQCTRLDVPFAYHSKAMDTILDGLRKVGQEVALYSPTIPVLSNVTGTLVQPGCSPVPFASDYFARHCREPARFHQGITDLRSNIDVSNVAACVELGPHPTTLSFLRVLQVDGAPLLLPSLRKKAKDFEILCDTLAQLYRTSVPVLWRKVFADLTPGARLIDLPQYPFAKTRFWVPYVENAAKTDTGGALRDGHGHSILAHSVAPTSPTPIICERDIGPFVDLIKGHSVAGVALCPASVYTELALSAVVGVLKDRSEWHGGDAIELVNCVYPRPLVYTPKRKATLRIEIIPAERHTGSFSICSQDEESGRLQGHCTGSYKRNTTERTLSKMQFVRASLERDVRSVLSAPTDTFSTRACYDMLFPQIVTYSPPYHAIQTMSINSSLSTGYAVVQLPKSKNGPGHQFTLSPIFVDAILHVSGFLINFTFGMNGRDACICSQVDKIKLLPELIDISARYGVYTSVVFAEDGLMAADAYAVELDDPRRRVVVSLKRVRFRKVAMTSLTRILKASVGSTPVPVPEAASVPSAHSVANGTIGVSQAALTASRDYMQRSLIDIIAETSGIQRDEVVPDANLSHLGIDSLMIWEVVSRINAVLPDSAIDTHTLATASTVGELVQIVMEKHDTLSRSSTTSSATMHDGDDTYGQILAREESISLPYAQGRGVPQGLTRRNEVIAVKDILSTILDIPADQLANDADLQSLGLDSLTSIEARHAFQTALGVTLDEDVMLNCGTVMDVVNAVASASQAFHQSSPQSTSSPTRTIIHTQPELIRLQSASPGGASIPPLILLHDGSGLVSGYAKLAQLECDVWAIQNTSYATTRNLTEASSGKELVAMAITYVGLLTNRLFWDGDGCRGPCFIGGWSFGGVLAFDIARRLSLLGVQVQGLILIDSPAPQTDTPLMESLIDVVVDQAGSRSATSARTLQVVKEQMRYATRALVRYDLSHTPPAPQSGDPRAVFLRAQEGIKLPRGWENQQVRAFLTKEEDDWTIAQWEEALGRKLTILDIPGNHFAVFDEENIVTVSEQLKRAIAHLLV